MHQSGQYASNSVATPPEFAARHRGHLTAINWYQLPKRPIFSQNPHSGRGECRINPRNIRLPSAKPATSRRSEAITGAKMRGLPRSLLRCFSWNWAWLSHTRFDKLEGAISVRLTRPRTQHTHYSCLIYARNILYV